MKKLLLLILIFCLILCSCDFAKTDGETDDNGDSSSSETTDKGTDDNGDSSSSETTDKGTDGIKLEPFPTEKTITELEEYQHFLLHTELPADFIVHEKLAGLGQFYALLITRHVNHPYDLGYIYFLETDGVLNTSLDYQLLVHHGYRTTYLNESDRDDAVLLPIGTSSNLKVYSGNGENSGKLWIGEIQYEYASGVLISVSWIVDDVEFVLLEWDEGGFSYVSTSTSDLLLRDLLNAETAEAAIERFAAKLRGETNADGE